jgi:hypothetical protein
MSTDGNNATDTTSLQHQLPEKDIMVEHGQDQKTVTLDAVLEKDIEDGEQSQSPAPDGIDGTVVVVAPDQFDDRYQTSQREIWAYYVWVPVFPVSGRLELKSVLFSFCIVTTLAITG